MKTFNAKCGFSLPEVCVAVIVLSAGISALWVNFDLFNSQVRRESLLSQQFLAAFDTMEGFIRELPVCADSSYTLASENLTVAVESSLVPGGHRLAWLEVRCSEISLRRLVRCK